MSLIVPFWLARLAAQIDELKCQAQALGFSDDRFEMIVRNVNDEAMVSPAWGTLDERLAEIRRRIHLQA